MGVGQRYAHGDAGTGCAGGDLEIGSDARRALTHPGDAVMAAFGTEVAFGIEAATVVTDHDAEDWGIVEVYLDEDRLRVAHRIGNTLLDDAKQIRFNLYGKAALASATADVEGHSAGNLMAEQMAEEHGKRRLIMEGAQ